ncbi:LysR substrate-binding domain-containing protein [Streptomyces mirabilis]|uniref:LysR substrate-binding domain-containing protein n=1 Tax=Streptomyces mirabilis TaxID=68239 RepID=UPI0033BE9CC6
MEPTLGAVTGIVTVGLLESASDLLAEPLVSALARDRPGIELRLMTAYSGHLQRWLDDGDLDLSLLYDLASTPSLNAHPLVREHLWAVAPPDAGLRPDRPVPFARVAAHPLVMPTAGHALRSLIDAAAVRAEVKLDVAVQTNSMRVHKRLVLAGHGWTILPGVGIAEDVAGGTLSAAPLSEPDVWRSIVLGDAEDGAYPTGRRGRRPRADPPGPRGRPRGQLARRAAARAGLRRDAPSRQVLSLSYRLRSPVFAGEHLLARGTPREDRADLSVATHQDPAHATAEVTFTER